MIALLRWLFSTLGMKVVATGQTAAATRGAAPRQELCVCGQLAWSGGPDAVQRAAAAWTSSCTHECGLIRQAHLLTTIFDLQQSRITLHRLLTLAVLITVFISHLQFEPESAYGWFM